MLLARITDVGEDQVVECCANAWMGVADLLWPKVKDIACTWRYVANNSKVVHKGIELTSSLEKITWIVQLSKVCSLGVFQERSCQIFNWRICGVGSC